MVPFLAHTLYITFRDLFCVFFSQFSSRILTVYYKISLQTTSKGLIWTDTIDAASITDASGCDVKKQTGDITLLWAMLLFLISKITILLKLGYTSILPLRH